MHRRRSNIGRCLARSSSNLVGHADQGWIAAQPSKRQRGPLATARLSPWVVRAAAEGARTGAKLKARRSSSGRARAPDAVFYIETGRIRLTVTSAQGKEGVIALFGPGDLFGEGCLTSEPLRQASAVSTGDSGLVKIDKATIDALLHDRPDFSESSRRSWSRAASRSRRISSISFSIPAKSAWPDYFSPGEFQQRRGTPPHPAYHQATLAARVGTTRARIRYFMNEVPEARADRIRWPQPDSERGTDRRCRP